MRSRSRSPSPQPPLRAQTPAAEREARAALQRERAQIKARAAALRAANSELRSLVTTELCETGKMGANGRCIVPPGLDTVKDDISLWVPMIQCERGPASPPLSM